MIACSEWYQYCLHTQFSNSYTTFHAQLSKSIVIPCTPSINLFVFSFYKGSSRLPPQVLALGQILIFSPQGLCSASYRLFLSWRCTIVTDSLISLQICWWMKKELYLCAAKTFSHNITIAHNISTYLFFYSAAMTAGVMTEPSMMVGETTDGDMVIMKITGVVMIDIGIEMTGMCS